MTTTFEHVCNAKYNKTRKYAKEYGAGAACVLHLCEESGIQGSEQIVVCDSWFGGIRLPLGLRKIGLHSISMIKTGSSGYCKDELKNKLMGDDIERGAHSVATTTVDGVKLIALVYQGKSDKGKKNKATKTNFYSYFLASECITTLDGKPAEKNGTILMAAEHHPSLYPGVKLLKSIMKGCQHRILSIGMPNS